MLCALALWLASPASASSGGASASSSPPRKRRLTKDGYAGGALIDDGVLSFDPLLNNPAVKTRELLQMEHLKDARFEVVMVDDREFPRDVAALDPNKPQYYFAMSAMLNCAYAMHFGYGFRYIKLNKSHMIPGYHSTWHKVFYVAKMLRELAESNAGPTWILMLDSDAYVREHDVPLPSFLANLAARYGIQKDVAAVVAEEMRIPGRHNPVEPINWLNTGVLLINANEHSRTLYNLWIQRGRRNSRMKRTWPYDQGIFHELVLTEPFKGCTPWGWRSNGSQLRALSESASAKPVQ
eukprot:TRINITY_DN33354_c0_g1_i3.p1 TRINITY_DN33354_c0_g1~~TRINITY_DN33354_c0_g1_i3.p1  ORF type:complete len:295 (-),score=50.87 TRINITY_DN33354_c0_g1_i3:47-931(-)